MFQLVTVDEKLADAVERELTLSKPAWQYSSITTNFYSITTNEKLKRDIEVLKQKYPVHDTQKFSDTIYNSTKAGHPNPVGPFIEIRQDPKSRYNQSFPNTAKLLNHLQREYIPPNYVVKRFFINLQTIRPSFSINEIHPDFLNNDYITILYYVNNSDGDTYFFEGTECVKQIPPVKGTAAIYPSSMLHAGSTPTKTETRVVINLCFGPKE